MFIKGWIRTILILAGLALFLGLNRGIIGYGEPYDVVVGNWIYTYQDIAPSYWLWGILALASTLTGCYIWAKLKSRHWAFMFWGLLTPIGLLGISLLKNKAMDA